MKETAVELGVVDDVVGGVVHAERRHLGLVGVERDGIAGGRGRVVLRIGEGQRRGDTAVLERMQVGGVGAVAGDAHHHVGVDAVREGDRAGADLVEAANREGDGGRLGVVDDVVGGVVHAERRHLGLVGVERDGIAGGRGRVVLRIGEGQRRGDTAVLERMQVGGVGAVAGDAHHHVGVDAVREGDRAGAGLVEAANREGDGGRTRCC